MCIAPAWHGIFCPGCRKLYLRWWSAESQLVSGERVCGGCGCDVRAHAFSSCRHFQSLWFVCAARLWPGVPHFAKISTQPSQNWELTKVHKMCVVGTIRHHLYRIFGCAVRTHTTLLYCREIHQSKNFAWLCSGSARIGRMNRISKRL